MNAEQAASLRRPFDKNQIGKLPRGGTTLSYVGHAATTDRLLSVDPSWTWEPVAFDQRGLPLLDEHGGLWIRLTVGGVTRLGYGDAGGKKGPNAVKEAIGDALRNAAMRFGVAIDLWAKEDLTAEPEKPTRPAAIPDERTAAKARVWAAAQTLGWDAKGLAKHYQDTVDAPLPAASADDLDRYEQVLLGIAEDNKAGAA